MKAPETTTAKPPQEIAANLQAELQDALTNQTAVKDEAIRLQQERDLALRKSAAEIQKIEQDNEGRRKFSWAIFFVMVAWMLSVLLTIMLCANGRWRLSDSVLIALITTTTATVIGVFVVVANYLFNREKST